MAAVTLKVRVGYASLVGVVGAEDEGVAREVDLLLHIRSPINPTLG